MQQFNLEEWLQDKSRKVVTRNGRPVRIICWDKENTSSPIVFLIKDSEQGCSYEYINCANIEGKADSGLGSDDLFFADEEEEPQSIEIPFGAFDSEFIKDEYYIPKGCEARIEGNKVIIEKIQKEEELTKFEKGLVDLVSGWCDSHIETPEEYINKHSQTLIDLARKELQPEIDKEIDKAYKNIDTIVYDNGYKQGQYEIMEDLPKWKKAEKDEELDCHVAIQQDDRVVLSDFVQKDEYYITLDVLKKLPKE